MREQRPNLINRKIPGKTSRVHDLSLDLTVFKQVSELGASTATMPVSCYENQVEQGVHVGSTSNYLNAGRPSIIPEQASTSGPTAIPTTKKSMTSRPQHRLRKRPPQSRGSLKSPAQTPPKSKSQLPPQHPKSLGVHEINQELINKGIEFKSSIRNQTTQNFGIENAFKIKEE